MLHAGSYPGIPPERPGLVRTGTAAILDSRIKHREPFLPFAPAVLATIAPRASCGGEDASWLMFRCKLSGISSA
jgi:hypothetical protein